MFSFDLNKIDLYNEIGQGAFAKIYPYKSSPQKHDLFVVKAAYINDFSNLLGYIQEIVLGFSCKHANVLPVRGYHIDYDRKKRLWSVYIKLDRMKCSLKSRINERKSENKSFSQKEIVNYLDQMSCGLEYLHSQGIVHRDINPTNILISKNEEIKIADIGSGKFVGDETSNSMDPIAGTEYYTAPEVLHKENASHLKKRDLFKADIWSLGVVIAEMCLLEFRVVDAKLPASHHIHIFPLNSAEFLAKISFSWDQIVLNLQ